MRNMEIKQLLRMVGEYQYAGREQEAQTICRRILVEHPQHAETLELLGKMALQANRHVEAVELLSRAIVAAPGVGKYHAALGAVLCAQGRFEEALAVYQQASRLDPTCARTHYELARVLTQCGHMEQALASYRQALALEPTNAETHNNMGTILVFQGRAEEAIAAYRSAIALAPDLAVIHSNLGNILDNQDRADEAMECYHKALALMPDLAEAHYSLGNLYQRQGLLDQAISSQRRAIQLDPGKADAHHNLLLSLHYDLKHTQQELCEEHSRWGAQFAHLARQAVPSRNTRDPDRPLRIGYVSPDLRLHPVAFFLLPLLKAHDHTQFHITCYSADHLEDQVTTQLRACCDGWRDIVAIPDQQAAELVRQDEIDILVDLALHSANNRLLLFAYKPAPVQVSYLGYCGTTGLSAIDWRLSDHYLDPPGLNDEYYTERTFRFDGTYWCYDPHVYPETASLPVTELPAANAGNVTFACLNNFAKVTEPIMEMWCEILRALPTARLRLHCYAGSAQERVPQFMGSRGVQAERLIFVGKVERMRYFQQYQESDIALDTYPYGGGTTTCDALWMGVPVVSLAGQRATSRAGLSLLTNVGLPELVARSPEEYVKIAVDLANDLPRLAELRSTLRQRMQSSPLMDGPRFASHVEAAYRQMWRTWCAQQTGTPSQQ